MNFLAHLYVSTFDEDFLTGSFVADSVKGRTIDVLPGAARQGVVIHRLLDAFTDGHPVFREACRLIRPDVGRWSFIVADILFDHFLATRWGNFSPVGLQEFASRCYQAIGQRVEWIPAKSQRILPHVVADDWLTNYADTGFLRRVFVGMHRRTEMRSEMLQAVDALLKNYQELGVLFDAFFPEAVLFVRGQILMLNPPPMLNFIHQQPVFTQIQTHHAQ